MRTTALILASLVAVHTATSAETLVGSHGGDADPVTEGWTLDLAGVGTTSGPTDDAGTPVWSIADGSTATGSAHYFRMELDSADLATALSSGWRVRAELRVENATDQGETQFFGFLSGAAAFQVHFRAESNGDMTVRLLEGSSPISGPTFVVPGGALTYHSYELVSDGASGVSSLLIDDVEVHTGYDGLSFVSPNGARFGCSTSNLTGTVHVKSVELWIAPTSSPVESTSWGQVKAAFP